MTRRKSSSVKDPTYVPPDESRKERENSLK